MTPEALAEMLASEPCAIHQARAWEAWVERLVLRGGESPRIARVCNNCTKAPKGQEVTVEEDAILKKVAELREMLTAAKPNDRSEKDRRIAILLTDLEKLEALVIAWDIQAKEGAADA